MRLFRISLLLACLVNTSYGLDCPPVFTNGKLCGILPVTNHLPGQYLSLRLFLPEINLLQPRQYRIANAPNSSYYRISVKREIGGGRIISDLFRSRLCDVVQVGDHIDVSAPAGVIRPKVSVPIDAVYAKESGFQDGTFPA